MIQERILIAALSKNRVIGKNGVLPWTLPEDWNHFKKVTKSCPFVMGRKSYESEDMLYSEIENVVLSTQALTLPIGFQLAGSLFAAFELLKDYPRIFIRGGSKVFEESLATASHLFLTEVEAEVEGDTFFPKVNWENWQKEKSIFFSKDERHEYSFYINEYRRKN